jgi:mannose-6-phosphate isomerase-like protein (cupin superfamily)
MKTVQEYIASGILEQYVLGYTTPPESALVEKLMMAEPAIQLEITAISESLEMYAMQHAIEPNPVIKPFLLATIDYVERIKSGEPVTQPPELNKQSVLADYAAWLTREDMIPVGNENIYAKIIGYNPKAITAIVWIKEFAPQEVHDNELEKFLVVEGSCDIIVGDDVYALAKGDYFSIPLHKHHVVKVTSVLPCKIILQRIAA